MAHELVERDERVAPSADRVGVARRRLSAAAPPAPARPLTVGAADDPLEAAAERMARQVVGSLARPSTAPTAPPEPPGTPVASRIARSTAATSLHPAGGPDGGQLDDATAGRIRRASGGGRQLGADLRPRLEQAFGADLGGVRIHANSALAPELGARAFTLGHDVHFAPGEYQPATSSGLHVLSHELAHVTQQADVTRQNGGEVNRVHRLMSAEAFKSISNAGRFKVRGSTVEQIDTLLAEYDRMRQRSQQLSVGTGGIEKAVNLLTHVRDDIALWRRSHAQDSSRQKQRAALDQLDVELIAELHELGQIHAAAVGHGLAGDLVMKENTWKQKKEGSAYSVFQELAPVIGFLIPSPGDSSEFEIAVKIPVDPEAAGYVGFRLTVGAERLDRTTTKLSLEAAVTGGVRVMGAVDVGLELGGFIQAQGKDPQSALQLLSWGWYRRFRESVLPREVANFMWGGSTGSVGWVRSEDWAASVERENFTRGGKELSSGVGSASTTNAFVRTGGFGSVGAEGGVAGVVDLAGEARFGGGTHYDVDTIEARKGKRGAQLGQAEAMPARGTTRYLGTRFLTLELSAGVSAGPFAGELGVTAEWLSNQETKSNGKKKGMTFEYLSGSFSASASMPLNGMLVDKLVTGLVHLGPQVALQFKKIALMAAGKDKSDSAEALGEVSETAASTALAFGAVGSEAFDPLDFSLGEGDEMLGLAEQAEAGPSINADESMVTLSLNIDIGKSFYDRSEDNPVAIDVTLNLDRAVQVDVSLLSLAARRSRRLLRLMWEYGSWKPTVD